MGLLRLLFLDESAVWLTQPNMYTWSIIAQPMEVPTSKTRGITARLNLMGCVEFGSNTVQHREIMGNTAGQHTVAFLDTLAEQAESACPSIVFLDQASIHTCRAVTQHRERWAIQGLTVVYLPVYSPELNLKYHKLLQRHFDHKVELRAAVDDADWGIAI